MHGVLVTYRRPDAVRDTLRVLDEQTRPLDVIWVVDNDPSDELRRFVEARTTWRYVPMPGNSGPAGGIAEGMRRVLDVAEPDDWIMVLDDDDPPRDCTLISDMAAARRLAPERTGALGIVGARFDASRSRLVRIPDSELEGCVAVDYVGGGQFPTIAVRAVRDVGVFDSTLFFGFDDLDYGLRLRSAGWGVYVVGELALRARTQAGRLGLPSEIRGAPPASPWRRYYSARNLVLIARRHGTLRTTAFAVARGFGNSTKRPLSWRGATMAMRGTIDGLLGRTGKRVSPV